MKPRSAGAFLAIACCLGLPGLEAQTRAQPTSYRLANGLEVIVVEDRATPFVRLDLVFKAGGIAQTSESAGHFHILEHLLLKGGEPPIVTAIGDLGPLDWNGETSTESLAFRMEVASSELEAGLDVWARLLRQDSFTLEAVAVAKAAVAAEAAAQADDPSMAYEGAMTKGLFPKFPWRRDPAGSPTTVAAATPEGLAKLKSIWLVPTNAALVIVGDVDAAETREAAARAFTDWKKAPSPWKAALPPQPKVGAARPGWFFLSDAEVPEGLALAEIRYRGPDLSTDLAATLAADLWTRLAGRTGGRLQASLSAALPSLQGPVSLVFLSQKEGGLISASAAFEVGKAGSLLDKVRALKETFRGVEVTAMRSNPAYFSPEEFEAARKALLAERGSALDGIAGLASELDFAWSSATLEWFQGYETRMAAVGQKEIALLLDTWILHNLEIVALRLNPADLEREAKTLVGGGFFQLKGSRAFWWQGR